MVDINTLVLPGSDIEVVDALYINDAGVVAGGGFLPNGDFHAVVLVPASPEEIAAASAVSASQSAPTTLPAHIRNAEDSASSSRRALNMLRQTRRVP
jgi:hypothetical protein